MKTIIGSPTDALLTLALFIAPALLLASSITYMATGAMGETTRGGVVMNLAFVAFALVAMKVSTLVAHRPWAAAALLVLALIGVAGGIGYGLNAYAIDVGGLNLNESTGLAAMALQFAGICFPLSMVASAVLLAMTRAVPLPVAIGLAVGGVLFPVGRIGGIDAVIILCDLVLLASLSAVALTSDDRGTTSEADARVAPAVTV